MSISIGNTVFQNGLRSTGGQVRPGVDFQSLVNAGATGLSAVIPPEQLPGVVLAYNEALVKVFVGLPGSLSTTLGGLLTSVQFIPTTTAAAAFLFSFRFKWEKIGVGEKEQDRLRATEPPAVVEQQIWTKEPASVHIRDDKA